MPSQAAMLAAQRRPQRIVTPEPIPIVSPIKGWNTRDPFEAMDPQDAITLDNLFADYGGVDSRGGTITFAGGLGNLPVRTLAEFYSGTVRKFLVACTGQIIDISTGAGIPLKSGFLTDAWQTTVFNDRQFWVNGQDTPQVFDGVALMDAAFTGVGLAQHTLAGVGVFDTRLYFWTGQDANFWFGGLNAIAGALSKFPLDVVSQDGGKLLTVQLLTYDGGTGISDYKCFFMDTGEVLIYSGSDPSNAATWSLQGRYVIPPPIAIRAVTRYGGDIYISTQNDHLRLSQIMAALKLGESPPRSKISGAQTAAWMAGSSFQGWQAIYYPRGTRLIFNIPSANQQFAQHVYNTSTQAWSRFLDMQSYCWATFNGALYFGSAAGTVFKADVGETDIQIEGPPWGSPWGSPWETTTSTAIDIDGKQAWQTVGTLARKRMTAMRPAVQITADQGVYTMSLAYDYRPQEADIVVNAFGEVLAPPWNTSPWGSPWASEVTVASDWLVAEGTGSVMSVRLSASVTAHVNWIRTDFLFEPGSAF